MKRYRSTLRIPLLDRSRPTGEGREEGKGKEESEGGGEGARVFRATKHNAITRSVNMRHQLCLGLFERKFCSHTEGHFAAGTIQANSHYQSVRNFELNTAIYSGLRDIDDADPWNDFKLARPTAGPN